MLIPWFNIVVSFETEDSFTSNNPTSQLRCQYGKETNHVRVQGLCLRARNPISENCLVGGILD